MIINIIYYVFLWNSHINSIKIHNIMINIYLQYIYTEFHEIKTSTLKVQCKSTYYLFGLNFVYYHTEYIASLHHRKLSVFTLKIHRKLHTHFETLHLKYSLVLHWILSGTDLQNYNDLFTMSFVLKKYISIYKNSVGGITL